MHIDFNELREIIIPHLDGGEGAVSAKMYMNESGKIILSRIPVGASIGSHVQRTSNDINYVLSGTGVAVCDGEEEPLSPGICHYCPRGASHSIVNTGTEELVLFSVVAEQR